MTDVGDAVFPFRPHGRKGGGQGPPHALARYVVRTALALLLAVQFFPPARTASAAATAHDWQTYTNARFGFSGCYPADVFRPQGEPENLDGQKFVSDDGASLLMFGRNNVLGQSLREAFQDASKGDDADLYTRLDKSWFVVSGRSGPRIRYRKTILSGDRFDTLQIAYDVAQRTRYDPLVARMAACFHAGR